MIKEYFNLLLLPYKMSKKTNSKITSHNLSHCYNTLNTFLLGLEKTLNNKSNAKMFMSKYIIDIIQICSYLYQDKISYGSIYFICSYYVGNSSRIDYNLVIQSVTHKKIINLIVGMNITWISEFFLLLGPCYEIYSYYKDSNDIGTGLEKYYD